MAWKMNRASDGNFSIIFFAEKSKSKANSTESGKWWADNNKIYMKTAGVPTLDVYAYSFINQTSVRFVNVQKDPSAACQADYEFTDSKVFKKSQAFGPSGAH